ncbi:hypothetical protein ACW0JT_14970 [Arthrobacter sp. SA17]
MSDNAAMITVELLPGEHWWGGAVADGQAQDASLRRGAPTDCSRSFRRPRPGPHPPRIHVRRRSAVAIRQELLPEILARLVELEVGLGSLPAFRLT